MQFKSSKSYDICLFSLHICCLYSGGWYAGEFILTHLSNSGTVVQLDFDGDKDPALVILRYLKHFFFSDVSAGKSARTPYLDRCWATFSIFRIFWTCIESKDVQNIHENWGSSHGPSDFSSLQFSWGKNNGKHPTGRTLGGCHTLLSWTPVARRSWLRRLVVSWGGDRSYWEWKGLPIFEIPVGW